MARTIHVATAGSDFAAGDEKHPFKTISHAADVALPGDTVVVHEGTYREWVDPKNGGTGETERIIYTAAKGEHVCIKGSEVADVWEQVEGSVWKTTVPNTLFGDFNPFATYCWGDWMIDPDTPTRHLGDVYLNGKSLYEATSLDEVANPPLRETGFGVRWVGGVEPMRSPQDSLYVWFAEVDEETTTIYANFQDTDPLGALVEISVRECCFYPRTAGKGHITVSGFEICQAATRFSPPTGDQPGAIGPHWSRGWIIEDCDVHDAKCSGVSLGRDGATGDNEFSKGHRRPGYNYQFEVVCRSLIAGWNKEKVGGHIVRRNRIHDCGQNGVVGHMGCAFSRIEDNDIYNIAVKHEFYGYEIAGIKLHAAIDTQIVHNNIHDCTLGIWLDWEMCGTRVSRNVLSANDRDFMIEVTHGPCTVDNNIFASPYAIDNVAQGTAFVHNLVMGCMRTHRVIGRSTPYHLPHSTQLLGSAFVFGGDDRWYNNILVGGSPLPSDEAHNGTACYNGHPASWEEYMERIEAFFPGDHDHDIYPKVDQAVYLRDNVYLKGSEAFEGEDGNLVLDVDPGACVVQEAGSAWLEIELADEVASKQCSLISTETLGITRTADAAYENPDGTPILFSEDISGVVRGDAVAPGPVASVSAGRNRMLVWERPA